MEHGNLLSGPLLALGSCAGCCCSVLFSFHLQDKCINRDPKWYSCTTCMHIIPGRDSYNERQTLEINLVRS